MVAPGADPSRQFLRRVKNRPPLRRRSRVKAWLRLAAVLLGIALGGVGAWLAFQHALSTELLSLREVAVDGAPPEVAARVERRLEPFRGRNLLSLDLVGVQRRIEELPRVRRASLRRRLPHGLHVEVEPRTPRAVVEAGDATVLVDDEAVVLGAAEPPRPHLPRLVLAREEAAASPFASGDTPSAGGEVTAALDVLAWLERSPIGLGADLDRVRIEDRGIVLVLENGLEILVGDADSLPGKFEAVEALLASEAPVPPATVDVRFRDMVVVHDGPR